MPRLLLELPGSSNLTGLTMALPFSPRQLSLAIALSGLAIPFSVSPAQAGQGQALMAQVQLLPPPPAGPHPVPNPSSFNLANASTYRVVALIGSPVQEQQVKATYPGAFATNVNGQRAMQIGSFSDPMNAQQAAVSLQNLGLETLINP